MMRTVLFLCTGNYYRSRFAEELFNHHALRAGLSWVARSRALAIECCINNVGPLSPFALKALEKRGLVAKDGKRSPQQCAAVGRTTARSKASAATALMARAKAIDVDRRSSPLLLAQPRRNTMGYK